MFTFQDNVLIALKQREDIHDPKGHSDKQVYSSMAGEVVLYKFFLVTGICQYNQLASNLENPVVPAGSRYARYSRKGRISQMFLR